MKTTPTSNVEFSNKVAMSVAEAMQVIGIGRTLFYAEVRAKRIPIRKIGRRSVVLTEDALAYLRALPVASSGSTSRGADA